jgi:hypothetical protein
VHPPAAMSHVMILGGRPRQIMAVRRRHFGFPLSLPMESHQIAAEMMCRSRLNQARESTETDN